MGVGCGNKVAVDIPEIKDISELKYSEVNARNIFKNDREIISQLNRVQYKSSVSGRMYFMDSQEQLDYMRIIIYYDVFITKSFSYFCEVIVKHYVILERDKTGCNEDKIIYFDDFRMFSEKHMFETKYYNFLAEDMLNLSKELNQVIQQMFFNIVGNNQQQQATNEVFNTIFIEDNEVEEIVKVALNTNIVPENTQEIKIYKIKLKEILRRGYDQYTFFLKEGAKTVSTSLS